MKIGDLVRLRKRDSDLDNITGIVAETLVTRLPKKGIPGVSMFKVIWLDHLCDPTLHYRENLEVLNECR